MVSRNDNEFRLLPAFTHHDVLELAKETKRRSIMTRPWCMRKISGYGYDIWMERWKSL
jgi:hypothetical protein